MSSLIHELSRILPSGGLLTGEDVASRTSAWGSQGANQAMAILRPRTTDEVSRCLAACHRAGQPVVPLGGATGLVQGGLAGPAEVVLSLELMNAIEQVDTANRLAIMQAGVPLQLAQETVEEHGLFLPLDLGARGTATIGGNISTNAGGNRVIRFGMMRDMVLGLEAVLADGTVMSSMNRVIKNNAGYDLKQLFIGTEGTLGIVTRAVLRLREKPRSVCTAFVAVPSLGHVRTLLKTVDGGLSGMLSAFEVMWNSFYRLVTTPPAASKPMLPQFYPYYVIVEAMGGDQEEDQARFERVLTQCLEDGLVEDAVIAKNESERDGIWAMRDDVGQVLQFAPMFTFDVSLPITEMESYVETIEAAFKKTWPDYRHVIFGHLGDGNIHVIVGVGDGSEEARRRVEDIVYRPLADIYGSVSAEHGIGLEKKPYLRLARNAEEVAVMRTLKKALDPKGILNPGKIFDLEA